MPRGIADGEMNDAVTAAEAHLDNVEHQMISKMV